MAEKENADILWMGQVDINDKSLQGNMLILFLKDQDLKKYYDEIGKFWLNVFYGII